MNSLSRFAGLVGFGAKKAETDDKETPEKDSKAGPSSERPTQRDDESDEDFEKRLKKWEEENGDDDKEAAAAETPKDTSDDDQDKNDKKLKKAHGAGFAEGIAAANARWSNVLASKEAEGKAATACDLLADTDLDATSIKKALSKIAVPSARSTLQSRQPAPTPAPSIDGGADPKAQDGPKGFAARMVSVREAVRPTKKNAAYSEIRVMTLTVTPIGDNPATPGSIGYVYQSDQLIAGDLKLVTQGFAMITGGLLLPRGTIMGKMTIGAVTSAPKAGGNTGNGTLTALSAGTETKTGIYRLRFVSASAFTLVDPSGLAMGAGGLGAYATSAINFTTTAGATPFIAGDGFDITVAVGSSAWKKSVKGAADGSQNACGILVDIADATLADVNSGIYLTGEFNENRVAYDPSWTLVELRDALRPWNIFLKSAVTANPPS